MILAPLGALSKKPPLQTKLSGGSMSLSDFYAVELMHILQDRGVRIPEDISIVGFDGSFESIRNNPELTTVKQDVTLRARYTIEILQNLRAGCKVPVTIKIPVSLIRRQSVKENIHFLSGE